MSHLHTCPIHRSPRFHAAVLLKFRPGHLMSLCFQREGLALSEVVKVSLIDSLSLLLLLFAAGLSVAAQVPCCSVCVLWLRESVFQRPSGTLLPFVSRAANHAEDYGNLVSAQVWGHCCVVCRGNRVKHGFPGGCFSSALGG